MRCLQAHRWCGRGGVPRDRRPSPARGRRGSVASRLAPAAAPSSRTRASRRSSARWRAIPLRSSAGSRRCGSSRCGLAVTSAATRRDSRPSRASSASSARRRGARSSSRRSSPAPAGVPLQWQYSAVHADQVAPEIAQAAAKLTIAVIDTGADLGAPDLAAKSPLTHSVRASAAQRRRHRPQRPRHVRGGARGRLRLERRGRRGRRRRSAADDRPGGRADRRVHRRRGGGRDRLRRRSRRAHPQPQPRRRRRPRRRSAARSTTPSPRERCSSRRSGTAIASGNPVEYPAALLQPLGSRGVGGRGLAVAASTRAGSACVVLEHRYARLARRARRGRLQRRVRLLAGLPVPTRRASRLRRGPLRLRQRHLVRGAAGRRRRSSRLGRQSAAAGRRGRVDPRADRLRPRELDRGARLRRARRRRGGRSGAGPAYVPPLRVAGGASGRASRSRGRRSRRRSFRSPSRRTASPSAC